MEKILKLVSRILSGINFASYELDALTYRAEPIKQRQSVTIPNLIQGKVTTVDLAGELKYNLLVTGLDLDIEIDDNEQFEAESSSSPNFYTTFIYANVISRKTGRVIKQIFFYITPYPDYTNQIILTPDHIYEFKPSRNINSITFTGEPVHLRDPIIFLNGVVKEELTPKTK